MSITPFYSRDGIRIYVGDNRDVLPHIDQVHAVCTDPPYGLSFMGKGWDHSVPGVEFWQAIMAAMLPGAHLLAFGGTRTYHRMAVAIEDAGYEIRDTLQWLYATGFPKSHDVSKAIDKMAGAEREVVGTRDVGPDIRGDNFHRDNGERMIANITAPATPEAEQWQGWGTALKPAYEPIIMARKPFKGNVAANVLAHGTGAINVDASRIGTEGETPSGSGRGQRSTVAHGDRRDLPGGSVTPSAGRWPANVILDEWMEQVSRLRYNIPNEVSRLIREFYRDYSRVPALPQADTNLSQPQDSDEVLRSGVLRGVAEQESQRRESPHARQEAHGRIHCQDESEHPSPSRGGSVKLEGRASLVAGLLDGGVIDIASSRASAIQVNGEPEQPTGDTGASSRYGAGAGQATDTGRDRSPQERRQDRQPAREPGDNRERRSQEAPRSGIAGTEASTRRERGAVAHPLHVLDCDIPTGWRQYFEPTGLEVRSPDCSAAVLDAQSGERPSRPGKTKKGGAPGQVYSTKGFGRVDDGPLYNDTGGASRFFYVAKASRRERNLGLDGMPVRRVATMNAMGDEPTGTIDPVSDRFTTAKANFHPTVKPLALMRYLIQMVTPPGGVLLDPFMGSGSTLVAAAELGFHAIGIELDPEYAEIAARRIDHALNQRAGYLPGIEGVA